jgi:hypothetical protein
LLTGHHEQHRGFTNHRIHLVTGSSDRCRVSNDGEKLTKDGVTSIFYRNVNDAGFAIMRLCAGCRTTADHHNDNPAWTDITDELC